MKSRFSESEKIAIKKICNDLLLNWELFNAYGALKLEIYRIMPMKELRAQMTRISTGLDTENFDEKELEYLSVVLKAIQKKEFVIEPITTKSKVKSHMTGWVDKKHYIIKDEKHAKEGTKTFTLQSDLKNFPVLASFSSTIKSSISSLDYLILTKEEKEKKENEVLERNKKEQEKAREEEARHKQEMEIAKANVAQKEEVEKLQKSLNALFTVEDALKETLAEKRAAIQNMKEAVNNVVTKYEATDYEPQTIVDVKNSIKKLERFDTLLQEYTLLKASLNNELYLNQMVSLLNKIHPLYEECKQSSFKMGEAILFEKEVKQLHNMIFNELNEIEHKINTEGDKFRNLESQEFSKPVVYYLKKEPNKSNVTEEDKNLLTNLNAIKSTIITQFNFLENAKSSYLEPRSAKKIENLSSMKAVMDKRFEGANNLLGIKSDIDEHEKIQKKLNDSLEKLIAKYNDYEENAALIIKNDEITAEVFDDNDSEKSLKDKLKTSIEKNQTLLHLYATNEEIKKELAEIKKEIDSLRASEYTSTNKVEFSTAFKTELENLEKTSNVLSKKTDQNIKKLKETLSINKDRIALTDIEMDTRDKDNIKKGFYHLVNGHEFEKIKAFIMNNTKSYKKINDHLEYLTKKVEKEKVKNKKEEAKCEAIQDFRAAINNTKNLQDLLNLIITSFAQHCDEFYTNAKGGVGIINGLYHNLIINTGRGFFSTTGNLLDSLNQELIRYMEKHYQVKIGANEQLSKSSSAAELPNINNNK